MTVFRVLLVFLTLTLAIIAISQAKKTLPGVKIRISKKGLDYVNKMATDKIVEELNTFKFPDQKGKSGRLSYSFTSIKNKGVRIPKTSMSFAPTEKGLTWTITGLGLKLSSKYRASYKLAFLHPSISGTIDVDIKSANVQITVSIGSDKNGSPTVSMAKCSSKIIDVDHTVHGATAIVFKFFKGTVNSKIKELAASVCKLGDKIFNIDANEALAKLNLSVPIAKHFLLDYSLQQAPNVQSNYVEALQTGTVTWIGDTSSSPYSPKPFPSPADDSRMLYLWLSEASANSLAYAAQKHDFLEYNLTSSKLKPDLAPFLDTTCSKACIGTYSPQIFKNYPNSKVEAWIVSKSTPLIKLSSNTITLAINVDAELYAHTQDKKTHYLFTMDVDMSLTLEATIAAETLTAKIKNHQFKVNVTKTAIGNVDTSQLDRAMGEALTKVLIPRLNGVGQKGVALPLHGSFVKFVNTNIKLLNGALLVSTDAQKVDKKH